MNDQPLVIYHAACPDGFTSAWVAASALGKVELFEGKHGEKPPLKLAMRREVYVLDFSYARPQLESLNTVAGELTVIDHHLTAEADLKGLPYCEFDMNRSGAGMTWDHFHPKEERPWLVDYVEDRDLWRFELPNSEEISLRIRCQPMKLDAWDALLKAGKDQALEEGRGAKLHLDHYVRVALRNMYTLPDVHEGLSAACVNVSYEGVSDVLHAALEQSGLKLALAWCLTKGGELACSARSAEDVDCSVFAKSLGGGGHAQASGFSLAMDHPMARRLLEQG